MNRISALAGAALVLGLSEAAQATPIEAQYFFGNTLTSSVAGGNTLTAVDPTNTSGFTTANVFGNNRTVYSFGGAASPPTQQGGLTFSNTGSNAVSDGSYSINMVTELSDRNNAWRRLVDVDNRQSDDGFYVDPSNQLDLFPVTGGSSVVAGTWYDITLTVNGDVVDAYLNGVLAFTANSSVMNITSDEIIGFFLDNVVGGGQGEWSAGEIAELGLYNGALTADEVAAIARDPFADENVTSVPEPGTLALFGSGLALVALARRRKKAAAAL